MKMKRFYLQATGNHVSIIHRPTHMLLGFLNLEDKLATKRRLMELICMTSEEFLEYMTVCRNIFLSQGVKDDSDLRTSDKEHWLESAWSLTTKHTLEKLKIKEDIPEEDFDFQYFKELKTLKDRKAHKREDRKSLKSIKRLKKEGRGVEKNISERSVSKKVQEKRSSTSITSSKNKPLKKLKKRKLKRH